MRYAAIAAVDHVHRITGLEAAHNLHDSELLIVDRPTWVKANTQSFNQLLGPVAEQLFDGKLDRLSPVGTAVLEVGGAGEIGGLLGFLSTRVLGQYDPYAALGGHGSPGGRLMIVAPNLVQLEEELNLEPADFRLWVALHEQTHRVQFAAAPWLRDNMLELVHRLVREMGRSSDNLSERITAAAAAALRGMKNREPLDGGAGSPPVPAASALLSPDGRRILEETTAIMSLLEGHANVVMDAVDASIVPSVKTIRRRFDRRSRNQGFFPRFMSKLLGMDTKLLQYKNGQKFVQQVIDRVGMQNFNRIWLSPQNLPTLAEISDPSLWIKRVVQGAETGSGQGRP